MFVCFDTKKSEDIMLIKKKKKMADRKYIGGFDSQPSILRAPSTEKKVLSKFYRVNKSTCKTR